MLVNNAGRSIRRGVLQSLDRFHDYERTMTLNYFGTIKLITSLLPHWRATGGGHIVNVQQHRRADQSAALRGVRRLEVGAGRVDVVRRQRGGEPRHHVHHDPHAAGAHPDDRADEDLRRVPDHHPRRGRRR